VESEWRPADMERFAGAEGLLAVATHPDADIVVVATSGHAAIEPTLAALRAGKVVALANKETIVCAGELVMREVQRAGHRLRPVDSEHSALWQCLATAGPGAEPERIILTASGGPFRTATIEQLRAMTAADALKHPTWNMGSKITIDSATLMNKGLEIIEAHWLYAMPYDRIDVVVNPQSVVHSAIAYADGSVIAQLGPADMRLPIQYALSYPERWHNPFRRVDLPVVGRLDFAAPDTTRFPSLLLARQAGEVGNTYPTVLSAADEVAVERFLRGDIGFLDIPALVRRTLDAHTPDGPLTLESIQSADHWAHQYAHAWVA
jgi:1-deoxy-D-xylulose-5-phosphate reductoisomerase